MIVLKCPKNNKAHTKSRQTVTGDTSSRVVSAGLSQQRPEGEGRRRPCRQPGKGIPSKGSEVEGAVNLVKEPQWPPGLEAQGGAGGLDEVSEERGGWVTQGPAGWGKDSGLFSTVDLKHSTECPGGRTRFHPE